MKSMWKSIAVWLAPLALVGVVLAADAPAEKKDAQAIQGTWQALSHKVGDRPASDDADRHKLVFEKDAFRLLKDGEVKASGTFTIDETKNPRTIDMKITEATEDEAAGKTVVGIYELKGDELKWCCAQPGLEVRPTGFDVVGTPNMLVTAKRAGEKK